MKEIIVKTQQEWDALPEKFDQETRIVIDAEPDRIITLTKNKSNSYVDITGTSFVHLSGVFIVREMRESSQVGEMRGSSQVGVMWGSSQVGVMWGSSQVGVMWESSQVREMRESSQVARCGKALRSRVMRGSSQVG